MVGIHARTGREKINDRNVAHVLNDETQRKYIQVCSWLSRMDVYLNALTLFPAIQTRPEINAAALINQYKLKMPGFKIGCGGRAATDGA